MGIYPYITTLCIFVANESGIYTAVIVDVDNASEKFSD